MQKRIDLSVLNNSVILVSVIMALTYAFIYLVEGDYLMMISSLLVMFLPFVIYVLEDFLDIFIPKIIKTVYLLFVLISAVLGAIVNFYGVFEYYDKFVHFSSGIVITLAFMVLLRYLLKNKYNDRLIIALGVIIFNTAVAAYWEICEFTFDLVFGRGVQRGLTDTMTDMMVAILGGLLVILFFMNKIMESKKLLVYKKTK